MTASTPCAAPSCGHKKRHHRYGNRDCQRTHLDTMTRCPCQRWEAPR